MNFEQFLEGLIILNSCLVDMFINFEGGVQLRVHKLPSGKQKQRLFELGYRIEREVDDQEPSGKTWEFSI